jgi:hypothetical protein
MGRIILVVLVALVAALVAAVRYLPWWGVLLTLAGAALALFLFVKFAFSRVLTALFMVPFKAKGAVLRGATALVHSIEPAEAPPAPHDEDEDEMSDEDGPEAEPSRLSPTPRDYFRLDATITPPPPTGRGFQHWEPGELMLAPADAKISLDSDDSDDVGLASVEILQGGEFVPDEGMKYFGPQRVRAVFGLEPGATRRLKFRYYFESFGEFTVPQPTTRTP